ELGDGHVASPYVFEPRQCPLPLVIERSDIDERRLIQPISPAAEIVRNRNDGTTSDEEHPLASGKETTIGLEPMRIDAHVVVGEHQQRRTRHPDAGVLPSTKPGYGLTRRPEPRVAAAPGLDQCRRLVRRAVVDDNDLEGNLALLCGESAQ